MGSNMVVGGISSMGSGYMKIDLYNRDGSYAGSMAVSTSRTRAEKKTSQTGKKKFKKLQYNFKRLSNQILRSKTSVNAKQVVTKTKFQIADLRMKLISGDYDYAEIHAALLHAERIARVAKKRLKHLEAEENIERTGKEGMTDPEEMRTEKEEDDEIIDTTGMSQEEIQELMQQLQEEMEKIEEELEDAMESQDFMEEFFQTNYSEMEPEDLEQLKKKHRAEELNDIMKADMEYLKAVFDRLAKEKESVGNGSYGGSGDSDSSYGGVSLELSGVDIPVETAAQAPVEAAGTAVDISV